MRGTRKHTDLSAGECLQIMHIRRTISAGHEAGTVTIAEYAVKIWDAKPCVVP
jgi:hypothetical protein